MGRRFHEQASYATVAGPRNTSLTPGGAAGMLRGDQPQIGHELVGRWEPLEIPDLGRHGRGRDETHPPEGHECLHQRGDARCPHQLVDGYLKLFDPLGRIFDAFDIIE